MDEARQAIERNTRLWMVGLRFRDASWGVIRHYYLVTAATPGQALGAGRIRSCRPAERDVRKGAPVDAAWWEVSEVVNDFAGPPHLRRHHAAGEGPPF